MPEKNGAAVLEGGKGYVPVAVLERVFERLDELRRERDHEAERADRAEEVQRYWIDQFEKLEEDFEESRLVRPAVWRTRIACAVIATAIIVYPLAHMAGRGVFGG